MTTDAALISHQDQAGSAVRAWLMVNRAEYLGWTVAYGHEKDGDGKVLVSPEAEAWETDPELMFALRTDPGVPIVLGATCWPCAGSGFHRSADVVLNSRPYCASCAAERVPMMPLYTFANSWITGADFDLFARVHESIVPNP